ncbi:MAG TPA: AraC family transcriptional regulator [bacterium]|nr:AraC family transcriptional regulator [bacterium]
MRLPYTEPAILLHLVYLAAVAAGAPKEPLLTAAGLTEEQFATPFMPIASQNACALLGEVVRLTGEPGFPMHTLEGTTPSSFGLIGYAVASHATVGMAIHRGLHGMRFFLCAYPVRLEERGPSVHEVFQPVGPAWPHRHRYAEYGMGLCLDVIRKSSGQRLVPSEVRFTHSDDEAHDALERYFGCPVRFGQARTEMVYPAHWLDMPCARADPDLADILAQVVDKDLARFQPTHPRLADLVRTAIADALHDNHGQLATVSRRLGLQPRSLQHLLHKEGARFADLLDEERRVRAEDLLRGPDMLDAVAYRLGYQSAAAFIRAFRRWTGQTPAQFRRTLHTKSPQD